MSASDPFSSASDAHDHNGVDTPGADKGPRIAAPEGIRAARGFRDFDGPDATAHADSSPDSIAPEGDSQLGSVTDHTAPGLALDDLESAQRPNAFGSLPPSERETAFDTPDFEPGDARLKFDEFEAAPPLGLEADEPPQPRADQDSTPLPADGGGRDGGPPPLPVDGGGRDGGPPPATTLASPSSQPPAPAPKSANADIMSAKTAHDREMGLFDHLAELRSRLLYCAIALMLGMVLTWNRANDIAEWFARPIRRALLENQVPGLPSQNTIISIDPTGFFSIYLQITMVSALIITMPFLFFQIWRFVEPALTNSERRYTLVLVPFSSTLFFLGAGLGYYVAPFFFAFFLQFQPVGVVANWDYKDSVVLMAKMLLVFGIMFQVPVIVIFLHKAGLVGRNVFIQYWRHVVVGIFVVSAILTPTWDPITLTICAGPPCLLYGLSIWITKWL